MSTEALITAKIEEPRWPNFVRAQLGAGDVGVDVGTLDDKTVDELTQLFKAHVLRRRKLKARAT